MAEKAKEQTCRRCDTSWSKHEPACTVCGDSLSHHDAEREAMCWEGLARTAWARRLAGEDVTDMDLEAMGRHPDRGALAYLV